jgi:hypothetical protein
MKLSTTREATSCAATQELPNSLHNPKVHYFIHKSPPLAPTLNQTNPVHITPFSLSPRSILILSIHLCVFLVASFILAFPPIIYMRSSFPHSSYMSQPSYPPWLDDSNYTWRRVSVTKLLIMPCHTYNRKKFKKFQFSLGFKTFL